MYNENATTGVVDHLPASWESEVRAQQGVRRAQSFMGLQVELACCLKLNRLALSAKIINRQRMRPLSRCEAVC